MGRLDQRDTTYVPWAIPPVDLRVYRSRRVVWPGRIAIVRVRGLVVRWWWAPAIVKSAATLDAIVIRIRRAVGGTLVGARTCVRTGSGPSTLIRSVAVRRAVVVVGGVKRDRRGAWVQVADGQQRSASDRAFVRVPAQVPAGEWMVGVVECRALQQQGLIGSERRALPEVDDLDLRWGAGCAKAFGGRGREVEPVADRDADSAARTGAEGPAGDAVPSCRWADRR